MPQGSPRSLLHRLGNQSVFILDPRLKILSMLGTGYFLSIAKINFQQEKPICPNRQNSFPQITKHRQSAKISCHTVI